MQAESLLFLWNILECTNRPDLGLALVRHLNHEKETRLLTVGYIQVTEVRKQ